MLATNRRGARRRGNFAIDPTGQYLLAANQDTDTIVTFRRDAETGGLTAAGPVTQTPSPVAILFSRDRPGFAAVLLLARAKQRRETIGAQQGAHCPKKGLLRGVQTGERGNRCAGT